MKHLDLFSGIGGFALAASWVWGEQYENVGHSEIDEFACSVYHKHCPESRCLGAVQEIILQEGRADLITGGIPCQPYSVAGPQRGEKDPRHLWPEMFRVIREAKPTWVVVENVFGLITPRHKMVFEKICTDLEAEGYAVQAFIIPALAVGAPHLRDRVWIVAHTDNTRDRTSQSEIDHNWQADLKGRKELAQSQSGRYGSDAVVTDTDGARREARNCNTVAGTTLERASLRRVGEDVWQEEWPEVAARLCSMDDGLSGGLVRPRGWRDAALKAAGNAIVPQVAAVIFRAIKETMSNDN